MSDRNKNMKEPVRSLGLATAVLAIGTFILTVKICLSDRFAHTGICSFQNMFIITDIVPTDSDFK